MTVVGSGSGSGGVATVPPHVPELVQLHGELQSDVQPEQFGVLSTTVPPHVPELVQLHGELQSDVQS